MMTQYRQLVFALALGLLCSQASAEVYKTVDKQGRVTYTDTPPAKTTPKAVELPSINTMPGTQATAIPSSDNSQPPATADYQLEITNPSNGTTLLPEERSVNISVNLNPALGEGMQLAYYLDGTLIEQTTQLGISLNEPPRGEHKLSAAVLDDEGKTLVQSQTVTIVVMRPMLQKKPSDTPANAPKK